MFSGNFPEGLRVLIFDEDPQYLLILEKQLQEFQYEVTRCDYEERVMYLLRNHRNRFDIAIIEAHNSDGDRFRLVSEIGSDIDLPIIIMSHDDSVDSVITWMKNGACDYLIKPIRPEELRFIYKHVAKNIQRRMSLAAGEAKGKVPVGGEKSFSEGDSTKRNPNKRKNESFLEAQVNEEDQDRASTSKKRRVVWEEELHNKFIEAVNVLGNENAVPKKILQLMKVEGISRENVASHLQKYRMNIKKQNDQIDRDKRNCFFRTPQEERMYVGEEATQFYREPTLQFPTHHMNPNIPQPSFVHQQQHSTNPNITTHLMSPLGHHDGADSVPVSSRDLVMPRQHHQQHHTSDVACNENAENSLGFNMLDMHNEEEALIENLTCSFTQNSENVSLINIDKDPVVTNTMIPSDQHHLSTSLEMMQVQDTDPSMLQLPSLPSSSYTHNTFFNQQEMLRMNNYSGGFNYNNGYSLNNNNNKLKNVSGGFNYNNGYSLNNNNNNNKLKNVSGGFNYNNGYSLNNNNNKLKNVSGGFNYNNDYSLNINDQKKVKNDSGVLNNNNGYSLNNDDNNNTNTTNNNTNSSSYNNNKPNQNRYDYI